MCSMPFSSGTIVSAGAWMRPSASSSAGAFTVTSRRSTGSRNSVAPRAAPSRPPRRVSGSVPRTRSVRPCSGRARKRPERRRGRARRRGLRRRPRAEHADAVAEAVTAARRPRPGVGHRDGSVTSFPQGRSCLGRIGDQVDVLPLRVDVERLDARFAPARARTASRRRSPCAARCRACRRSRRPRPASTSSAKRIARCRLAVWIADVSPYGESLTSAIASSRSRTR